MDIGESSAVGDLKDLYWPDTSGCARDRSTSSRARRQAADSVSRAWMTAASAASSDPSGASSVRARLRLLSTLTNPDSSSLVCLAKLSHLPSFCDATSAALTIGSRTASRAASSIARAAFSRTLISSCSWGMAWDWET